MTHDGHHDHPKNKEGSSSRAWIAFAAFAAVVGFLLLYEHRAHLLAGDTLLFALLAACVGVHLFMHGGHGGHGGGDK